MHRSVVWRFVRRAQEKTKPMEITRVATKVFTVAVDSTGMDDGGRRKDDVNEMQWLQIEVASKDHSR